MVGGNPSIDSFEAHGGFKAVGRTRPRPRLLGRDRGRGPSWSNIFHHTGTPIPAAPRSRLHELALPTNKIYIFDQYEAAATVFELRDELWNRKAILSVGNEAAGAAPTKGASKNRLALALVYTLWSVAACYDIAFWIERVPTKLNPADLPR